MKTLTKISFIQLIILLIMSVPLFSLGSHEESERSVKDFDTVIFKTSGRLIIEQGAQEYLRIEAPQSVLDRITTEVKGHKLHIGYKGFFTGKNINPIIRVGMKDIQELSATSSGSMELEKASAHNIEIKTSSSGDISIDDLHADDIKLRISSSGSIEIGTCNADSVKAAISSSGDLLISGKCDDLDLICSSSGSFNGEGFSVENTDVRLSSSGDAVLEVNRKLKARLSSSGSLSYYGRPEIELSSNDRSDQLRTLGVK